MRPWSCALVPVGVVNLASCPCVKSEEEGLVKKNRLQYFECGLQYLVQPLGVNPTYSTFVCCHLLNNAASGA